MSIVIIVKDHSWSRRCSTETILSIQGQETDIVRDTSDTEAGSDCGEYEPVTDHDDAPLTDSSPDTDNDIITTKVVEVSVGEEGELVFADSERTDDGASDSDVDLFDYWTCAQCASANDNPTYRYCRKCFQARKSLFPPRPRRRHKRGAPSRPLKRARGIDPPATPQESPDPQDSPDPPDCKFSQDSGIEASQGTSQDSHVRLTLKRRADSVDLAPKRAKYSDGSDSDREVSPLAKTLSDPSITIENPVKVTKKVIADTLKELETKDLCVVCISEPKSGVFVHGRVAHICCCYRCAVKVWARTKRCPVCNCKISNVLKAVVM